MTALTRNTPFRLVFGVSGATRAAAFEVEAAIFAANYGVTYPEHVAEFAPYEDCSTIVAVLAGEDDVVGVMRLITPGPAGLKTLVDAGRDPWRIDAMRAARVVGIDPERTWDVATLGVPRGIGRHRTLVSAALYHALATAAPRNGVRSLLMTVDERVRTILTMVGLFTTALPGAAPAPFEGSPASTPVYGHCAQMFARQRRENPEAYRQIALGVGLDGVSVPAPEEYLLDRPAAAGPAAGPAAGLAADGRVADLAVV